MQNESSRVVREKVRPGIWRRKSAKGRWTYEIAYRDSDGVQRRQKISGGMREAQTALAAEWIEAKAPNLTEKTVTTYTYGLEVHLLPAFGRKRLQEIDVTAVAKFIARMATPEYRREIQERTGQTVNATTGYSVQTIKSVLIPLSRTFAYAKRHLGFAGENPVSALDLDERPGFKVFKTKKRKLGRDELDLLIEAAESPWREIIATAAALGTRLGETLGLTWRCIDFESGVISIEQQANSKRQLARVKTQTGVRKIEAPDWLISMFRELKIRSPYCSPDELVFCTRTGRPHGHGNVLARGLYPALDRAGLPRTSFHSLRHTHASLWIKDGGDVITLSKRLGHATPMITMSTYADEIEEAADSSIRKARVNALFGATKMAARMAATDGETMRETASSEEAEVIALPLVGDSSQQAASA